MAKLSSAVRPQSTDARTATATATATATEAATAAGTTNATGTASQGGPDHDSDPLAFINHFKNSYQQGLAEYREWWRNRHAQTGSFDCSAELPQRHRDCLLPAIESIIDKKTTRSRCRGHLKSLRDDPFWHLSPLDTFGLFGIEVNHRDFLETLRSLKHPTTTRDEVLRNLHSTARDRKLGILRQGFAKNVSKTREWTEYDVHATLEAARARCAGGDLEEENAADGEGEEQEAAEASKAGQLRDREEEHDNHQEAHIPIRGVGNGSSREMDEEERDIEMGRRAPRGSGTSANSHPAPGDDDESTFQFDSDVLDSLAHNNQDHDDFDTCGDLQPPPQPLQHRRHSSRSRNSSAPLPSPPRPTPTQSSSCIAAMSKRAASPAHKPQSQGMLRQSKRPKRTSAWLVDSPAAPPRALSRVDARDGLMRWVTLLSTAFPRVHIVCAPLDAHVRRLASYDVADLPDAYCALIQPYDDEPDGQEEGAATHAWQLLFLNFTTRKAYEIRPGTQEELRSASALPWVMVPVSLRRMFPSDAQELTATMSGAARSEAGNPDAQVSPFLVAGLALYLCLGWKVPEYLTSELWEWALDSQTKTLDASTTRRIFKVKTPGQCEAAAIQEARLELDAGQRSVSLACILDSAVDKARKTLDLYEEASYHATLMSKEAQAIHTLLQALAPVVEKAQEAVTESRRVDELASRLGAQEKALAAMALAELQATDTYKQVQQTIESLSRELENARSAPKATEISTSVELLETQICKTIAMLRGRIDEYDRAKESVQDHLYTISSTCKGLAGRSAASA